MTPAGSLRVLAGVALFVIGGACDREVDSGPATLELEGDTIQLEAGVRLIDVTVETKPDGSELEPAGVEAAPGDVVRFTAGDGRLHAIAFESDLLGAEAAQSAARERGHAMGDHAQWCTAGRLPVHLHDARCARHHRRGTTQSLTGTTWHG